MARKTVVIKKYENRRLYDTTNSRYINQDEVAQMIRDGCEVQVVDAATGEDLTRLVLTQIIVEDAKEQGSAFPLDILRQMVAASGRATQETTLKYMKAFLDMYQNAYRAMTPPLNPFDFMRAAGSETPPAQPFSTPPSATATTEPTDVDELKQRVQELEGLVSKLRPVKKGKKKGSKRSKKR